jgi:BirA family transcriptional regulator, biotin operon repressor / biotin---[acetyl-CoA-carboxylase] ligase
MHGRINSSRPVTPRLHIETVDEVDSTNSELLRREPLLPGDSPADAIWLVAMRQTAGRGRRERNWVSTADGSLTGSFAREAGRPLHLGGLSLVAGLAVAQALDGFGVRVRLKWPNDLHVDAGKAGGILCEARGRGDLTRLVIGCGLNLLAPRSQVGQPAAGLFGAAAMPDRSELVAAIGTALLGATDQLLAEGFEPFRQAWSDRDLLLGRPILIHDYEGSSAAVARGIDGDGALLVEPEGKPGAIRRVLAEEVSVRPLS